CILYTLVLILRENNESFTERELFFIFLRCTSFYPGGGESASRDTSPPQREKEQVGISLVFSQSCP
ncbi:MAG: hypothetical protein RSF35_08920, partial [Akkermansia sp.]